MYFGGWGLLMSNRQEYWNQGESASCQYADTKDRAH